MRPRSLDEVVGQPQLTEPGRPLRRALEQGALHSMILWGPPGTGKTTLARLLADVAGARFVPFSAVVSGVKEIRQVMTEAEMPQLETYFVYPEEMKNLARIQVFRDFLVGKAQRWAF